MNALTRSLVTAACVGALAGCASTTPAPVLLTLPPALTETAGVATPAASAPLLLVRRVAIPEYLQSRRVRYRSDASTLAEWPNTFWAERIEAGVSREFIAALRRQLPGWSVCDEHCGDRAVALTLQVELLPLDYVRSTKTLQARSRITLTGDALSAREPRTREASHAIPATADTPQAQSQAMAQLIQQVATDAAREVAAAPR